MEPRASLILANRAFIDHGDAGPGLEAGQGGLIAALRPAIAPWEEGTGTTWIGAGRGSHDREFTDEAGYELIHTPRGPLRHQRLFFDAATWRRHYGEVANSFLWPLLHLVRVPLPELTSYYPAPAQPSPTAWRAYAEVNAAFARAAFEADGASAWVHDYQLALVPGLLRAGSFAGRLGFFLHTPFPDLALAERYLSPSSLALLATFVRGILGADLVGMQTDGDCLRFARAARAIAGASHEDGGVGFEGRRVCLGTYPVGIDADELVGVAREAALPAVVRPLLDSGLPLVVGLERADFTKGIPERLAAVARTANAGVRFTYVGVAAPTREEVPAYRGLEDAVSREAGHAEAAVARAGGRFLQLHGALPWPDVVALQREADVVFTSSLADGMNLVALQAAAAQSLRPPERRGVVIVGRDAGVASIYAGFEADGLVIVDPLDLNGMTEILGKAVAGRLARVSDRLVAAVRAHSARAWATGFLGDLERAPC
ncbi:MAG: trehalose-6-phosphate synthase [Dehalococcoidia bacterium]|nr:trehalose-6-phosphate synthase [Dehalococcoidia bacterium]